MDQQNMVYTYNEMWFCLNKEGNSDTRDSVSKPGEYYAEWNEPVTEEQILYVSVKSLETEYRMQVPRDWEKRGTGSCLMGVESQFHKMQRALEMDCTTMNILTTSELYT